ncbi:MAG: lytic transglycosylase domain-containing protein [Anderseniella sp.]|jgi:membrane-bound lytic murein transglycosylase B|nr:lytic transglycosylase domain-containing protein [Anderseniella sp.]
MRTIKGLFIALALTAAAGATPAYAVKCGNTGSGFEAWKQAFAAEAKANGINNRAIQALMGTSYATKTIHADRNQKSFKLSYEKFKEVRGTATIVRQGRGLKKKHAALFKQIEAKYGVPAGPLIAIWGMETAFGKFTGNQNVLSAVATLAYDCRRSAFFTEHLYHMLRLVGSGKVSAGAKGAMHGELGQTQFMPKAIAQYAVGDLNTREGALMSTANFLKGHGWRRGAGYQPGQPNFAAIQGWNAAKVYQRAIAEMGAQIDGG